MNYPFVTYFNKYVSFCLTGVPLCTTTVNPCLNGGTCYNRSDIATGQYRCACPEPYVGERCEMRGRGLCLHFYNSDSQRIGSGIVRLAFVLGACMLAQKLFIQLHSETSFSTPLKRIPAGAYTKSVGLSAVRKRVT
jgi:hypothetical protein